MIITTTLMFCGPSSLLVLDTRFVLQAILEKEKRAILALREAVERQDYEMLKDALAQAEGMQLTGEEVKQAQAMRLRIEVSFDICCFSTCE